MQEQENQYECSHYKKKCQFIMSCCDNKQIKCHRCHNDQTDFTDEHKFVKPNAKIICIDCATVQNVSNTCECCKIKFSEFFCDICCIYDIDKDQYHCDRCGICRIGKTINKHCDNCKCCRSIEHECKTNMLDNICPICTESLFDSQVSSFMIKCGHVLHSECANIYFESNYRCPFCSKAVADMSAYFEQLDKEIKNTPMPDEYSETILNVSCNECSAKSNVKFHIFGMKCDGCGSYNTVRE